jgi:hypothetical protein
MHYLTYYQSHFYSFFLFSRLFLLQRSDYNSIHELLRGPGATLLFMAKETISMYKVICFLLITYWIFFIVYLAYKPQRGEIQMDSSKLGSRVCVFFVVVSI